MSKTVQSYSEIIFSYQQLTIHQDLATISF